MDQISEEIGAKIRFFRKRRHLTLQELADAIHKSRATTSKYENGTITIDIVTLYEIARVLGVRTEELLFIPSFETPGQNNSGQEETMGTVNGVPTFFTNLPRFFSYVFDGRTNRIMRCVFDVGGRIHTQKYQLRMYMNFTDYDSYQNCETTYEGSIEHFDVITTILLTNEESPAESALAQILAPYASAETKWGLFQALSSRPLMPVSTKMLFSKSRLKEDDALKKKLILSREDIRNMKYYNMLGIMS